MARFDDLVDEVSWEFDEPADIFCARRIDEVPEVLRSVDAATRAGSWAYGYVAAEAASAFDPAFPARAGFPDGPPLAWFALCAEPRVGAPIGAPSVPVDAPEWRADWSAEQHGARVEQVRAAIAAGDVYQCNLTTRMRGAAPADPIRQYAQLAHAQRGAYNAYLDIGSHVILSASPELFFEWSADELRW
jgi:para-aminobenzoate synthetase/4-amino-4-deoxychorismate lyase